MGQERVDLGGEGGREEDRGSFENRIAKKSVESLCLLSFGDGLYQKVAG
jgi:hypothetical protein